MTVLRPSGGWPLTCDFSCGALVFFPLKKIAKDSKRYFLKKKQVGDSHKLYTFPPGKSPELGTLAPQVDKAPSAIRTIWKRKKRPTCSGDGYVGPWTGRFKGQEALNQKNADIPNTEVHLECLSLARCFPAPLTRPLFCGSALTKNKSPQVALAVQRAKAGDRVMPATNHFVEEKSSGCLMLFAFLLL